MKDPVFTGKDVDEALKLASRTLSIPQAALRYVVLDPGSTGGRGLSPTEARIAVLFELSRPGAVAVSEPEPRPHEPRGAASVKPSTHIREIVRCMVLASGQELDVEIREGRDTLDVHLVGPGTALFFDESGDTLRALEYLFDRMYGWTLDPQRVRVTCAGFREHRENVVQRRVQELSALVRSDGSARTTEPMNSYERRIVHLALEQDPDMTTYSVGEGRERRVTIALADSARATGHAVRSIDSTARPQDSLGGKTEAEEPVKTSDAASRQSVSGATAGEQATAGRDAVTQRQEPATPPEQPAATPTLVPTEPTNRPQPELQPFDYARFNRPAEGQSAPELM